MYAQIQWTSYRFSAPETLTEELYDSAKFSTSEFHRQRITNHLRDAGKHVGRTLLVAWGVAAALIGIAILIGSLDGAKRGIWWHTFGQVLGITAVILAFSGALSAASFIKYALQYRSYWLAISDVARNVSSYCEFLAAAGDPGFVNSAAARGRRSVSFNAASMVVALLIGSAFLWAIRSDPGAASQSVSGALVAAASSGLVAYLFANFYLKRYS
jgi:hypothetical protein